MLRATIPLGRVKGIPIGAHWSVLAIFALITQLLATSVLPPSAPGASTGVYWTTAAVTAACFFVSLLAHELAHSLVAKRYRVRVERITLWLLGGVAQFAEDPPNPRADLRIAVAGPLMSLVIGLLCLGAASVLSGIVPPIVFAALLWIALTNGVIAVFNLLPGAPLDGGRVLRALLWKRSGDREGAAKRASKAGQGLGVALIALGGVASLLGMLGGLWMMLIGWFLLGAAGAEMNLTTARRQLSMVRVADVMCTAPTMARGWWTVQTFLERTAAESSHRVFPVVSFVGEPMGTVSLADLRHVAPEVRMSAKVSDVCRRLSVCAVTTSDAKLVDAPARARLRPGRDLLVVVDNGVLSGIVSTGDLARARELADLGVDVHRPAPPPHDPHEQAGQGPHR